MEKMASARAAGAFVIVSIAFAATLQQLFEPVARAHADGDRPVARKHHALTYDKRSERVVLYGGATNEGQTLDDFWSWDGQQWTLIARSAPASGHTMFSDENGTLFLVGGATNGMTAFWDGSVWIPLLREPRRWGVAATYDAARARYVLHGGGGPPQQPAFGDTLEFDGTSWTQVAREGPGPRATGAMTFDDTRNIAVLFGGLNFTPLQRFDDLWEWDGVQWRQIAVSGDRPQARNGFAMTYDSVRRELVLFGGLDVDGSPLSDTWLWNGGQWRRVEGEGPSARDETYLAFDKARGVAVLFAGDSNNGLLDDTWEWDGSRWNRR